MAKETFDGEVVATGMHSTAPGGFVAAGVDLGRKPGRKWALRTEAKLHLVSFSGDEFDDQEVGGPLLTVAAGFVF